MGSKPYNQASSLSVLLIEGKPRMNRRVVICVTSTAILILEILAGFHGPWAPSPCRAGRPLHRISNLHLVNCRILEGPRGRCAPLAAAPSTWGMAYAGSSLRCPARSHLMFCRPSRGQICRAGGFHFFHVGVMVVPAGPGTALDWPIRELTLSKGM